MPKFIPYDPNQSKMVVINYTDQLQPGTFEFAIHYLIENKLDLSVFYPRYQNDENGRPAYDPALLLKIILFAYSKGITSSREIQWCCETNVIFKALACDQVPHFTTLAAFISERSEEIENVFEQVLLICDQEGLLGKELFAIDGCKMPSNASKEWSGTFDELKKKRDKIHRQIQHCLREHQRLDQQDNRDEERIKRMAQTIQTLDKAHTKIDNFLKKNTPRIGQSQRKTEVKSNITDNQSAKMTTSKGTIQGYTAVAAVDKQHQIIVDAQAFGEGQEHHTLQPVLERLKGRMKKLKHDLKHTVITADTGYANEANMQYLYENQLDGYIPDNQFRKRDPKFQDYKTTHSTRPPNAQKEIRRETVTPPSEFEFNPKAKTCTCPAGHAMWLKNERTDLHGHHKLFFEGRLTKCRSCDQKHQCMRNPASADTREGHGRQVSFIIKKCEKKKSHTDWMKQRIDSDKGRYLYSHRISVVEPVFANISATKRLKRFSLRGKKKVQTQWHWYCLVHNIEKWKNYGELRTQ